VYRALGVEANISYHSDVSEMAHCSYKSEYNELLVASIAEFLKHESEEPGRFEASTSGSGNLAEWKDWETPALPE
jgi:hypothetical protein